MKLENLIGYFDARVYKANTPRASRQMVEAGGRINFTTSFEEDDLPVEFREFAKLSEKSGRWFVTFKIFPKSCKLFTAAAKQINFPDYAKLDNGRFEVNVDIAIKHGTGTELNGLYVNAIQFIKRADVPFEPIEGGDDDVFGGSDDPFAAHATAEAETKSGLPF